MANSTSEKLDEFLKNDLTAFEKKEEINHPERYGGDTTYECIKVLKAWLNPDEYKGFLKGNCIKYICRCGKKDAELQELKKAKWYLEKLIEEFEVKDGCNNFTGNN